MMTCSCWPDTHTTSSPVCSFTDGHATNHNADSKTVVVVGITEASTTLWNSNM